MNGIFQDANGNKSSKRVIGAILVTAGGLFLLVIGVTAIFKNVTDPTTALDAGKTLIYAGSALLGVGVFEGIGTKIQTRQQDAGAVGQ